LSCHQKADGAYCIVEKSGYAACRRAAASPLKSYQRRRA
jgi:hypothetical protein